MLTKDEQLKTNKLRKRKCKTCRETFRPEREGEVVCSTDCAIPFARELVQKEKRKAKKQFRAEDKSVLMKLAQQVFNKYIRLRDKDMPCISCGHTGNRQRHAGHFMPVGSNGHIRFDESNCHSQCSICNNHKSGNLAEYEPNLVLKIGQDEVNRLKHKFTRAYDVEELKDIIETYKQKVKEL